MSHSTVRLGNGELDAVTELHRVNLSPENRFEASPLRGNSTATGTFRRHLGVLVRELDRVLRLHRPDHVQLAV